MRTTSQLPAMAMLSVIVLIVVLVALITFTVVLCVSSGKNNKITTKRSRKTRRDGELFQHPLFINQRKSLAVEEVAKINGTTHPFKISASDEIKQTKDLTDKRSTSMPDARTTINQNNNSQPHDKAKLTANNSSECMAMRKVKTESCVEVVIHSPVSPSGSSANHAANIPLMTINSAYGSNVDLRPISAYVPDTEKQMTDLNASFKRHDSLPALTVPIEKNPSYTTNLELSQGTTDDEDDGELEYSYATTMNAARFKNSTWPGAGYQNNPEPEEAVGIYIELDYSKDPKPLIAEENPYI